MASDVMYYENDMLCFISLQIILYIYIIMYIS